jgi:hypothetical protein
MKPDARIPGKMKPESANGVGKNSGRKIKNRDFVKHRAPKAITVWTNTRTFFNLKGETMSREINEVIKFTLQIAKEPQSENDHDISLVEWIALLLKKSRSMRHYAEVACSYGLSPRQETLCRNIRHRIKKLAKERDFGVKFKDDPRGYTVRLLLPSGAYNTWGGKEEGYGVPGS